MRLHVFEVLLVLFEVSLRGQQDFEKQVAYFQRSGQLVSFFLILFFVLCGIWKSVKRQCSVWIKNLFFELFPMICIFSWWIKSLIPKNFWYGSRMTMRKIEILLLAKVELIVYLFISMNQSYSCFGSTFFDVDCGQVRSLGLVGFLVQNTTMFRKWMHHTIMEIDP